MWNFDIKQGILFVACVLGTAFNLFAPWVVNAQDTTSDADCKFSDYTPAVIRTIRRNWHPADTDTIETGCRHFPYFSGRKPAECVCKG